MPTETPAPAPTPAEPAAAAPEEPPASPAAVPVSLSSPPSDRPSGGAPPPPAPPAHGHGVSFGLALGALGVVYGDIGTSPLYALKECFNGPHGVEASPANVLGVLSLIFWALTTIVSVKYLVYIMRADNRGEGGILALMALAGQGQAAGRPKGKVLVTLGLVGAALLYGDGMITPAISVLSAVEGLEVATPAFSHFVAPVTVAILVGLFLIQSKGTHAVGRLFGPVMLLWFACLAALGVTWVAREPAVLRALDPRRAVEFFRAHGAHGYFVLGGVFLSVTGGEALYADMGHFGRAPIRWTWFAVAMPALFLNYLGQGALLLTQPEARENPFFRLAPAWALLPLVALATAATVIASQALISASFSLTRQAVQLGYSPRVKIVHTSESEIGQIYVPAVNFALGAACIALVLGFGSSTRLAAAYGIAVTCTMAITTVLFFFVLRDRWGWPLWKAAAPCGLFLSIDAAFLGANAVKFAEGGWVPIVIGALIYGGMAVWAWGRTQLGLRLKSLAIPLEEFLENLRTSAPVQVPGTAVFMSGNTTGTPPSLLHNLKHNKVLHKRVVLLTILTEEVPRVEAAERLRVEQLGAGIWRMVARYGFMEGPDVPRLLEQARGHGLAFKMMDTTFFLGRETIVPARRGLWDELRQRAFQWMSLNARTATAFFGLPPNRVVELGTQVEL